MNDTPMGKALDALLEIQRVLDDANVQPGGPIADTIWRNEHETLFDYIASEIASLRSALAQQGEKQPVAWADAESISDLPAVDEAIRALLDDQTGDNATALVQVILEAAQPVQREQQPVAWPSKITDAMHAAGQCAWMTSDGVDPCRVFNAMLAAAPAAPAAQQTEWDIRGTLAKLKCWHRLTEEEATELVTIYAGANK